MSASPVLPEDLWATVQASVPIPCVDVVPVRGTGDALQVGLIRRRYADAGEPVWCHLGGRVRHGETTDEALARHVRETLVQAHVDVGPDPQPHHVVQWFPPDVRTGDRYGRDPRKHALSLCWALPLGDHVRVRDGGEGTALHWFRHDLADLSDHDLWPGTRHLVAATLRGAGLPGRGA
jgi:ADP-ribose pyrophosphatase YjhB (NUDIX family)